MRQGKSPGEGNAGSFASVDELISVLGSDEDGRLKEAINELNSSTPLGEIVKMLNHPSANVRLSASEAIGARKERSAAESLLPLLGDEVPIVRVCTIDALMKIGGASPGALEGISSLISDESEWVRETANKAVLHFGRASVPPLMEILRGGTGDKRQSAARRLGELREASAVPLLLEMILEEDMPSAWAASSALRDIDDAMSAASLLRAAKGASAETRACINNVLCGMVSKDIGRLLEYMNSEDEEMREFAFSQLAELRNPLKSVGQLRKFAGIIRELKRQEAMGREVSDELTYATCFYGKSATHILERARADHAGLPIPERFRVPRRLPQRRMLPQKMGRAVCAKPIA